MPAKYIKFRGALYVTASAYDTWSEKAKELSPAMAAAIKGVIYGWEYAREEIGYEENWGDHVVEQLYKNGVEHAVDEYPEEKDNLDKEMIREAAEEFVQEEINEIEYKATDRDTRQWLWSQIKIPSDKRRSY